MPLPMSVESESKETTVASSEALTRWYNLSEEVLVLHQTLKISAFTCTTFYKTFVFLIF